MVRAAVENVLREKANRTWDLGGELSTQAMGDRIVEAIGKI